MTTQNDIHVETARLQQQIENHLGVEGSLIFDFINEDNKIKLNLITVNQRHNQSFLFHSVYGINKLDSLKKMFDYVSDYKEKDNSYTIQWRIKGDRELHTSYFRARNIYEGLDKLYYNRDSNAITVYSIVLNPEA